MSDSAIEYSKQATHDLSRIDETIRRRIEKRIARLGACPETGKPLEGPLAGYFSVRVGGYRVVYDFDAQHAVVEIILIGKRQAGKRRDAYLKAKERESTSR